MLGVLLLAGLLGEPQSGPPTALAGAPGQVSPPEVGCYACLVVDDTGRILFSRHGRAELPNASTTKMMTALVAVEGATLDEEVRVSSTAAAVPGGLLSLEPGERFSVEELLQALLLSSSNDAAVALAEHVAGSESAFVALMNAEAETRGLGGTRFATAHGLDAPGHHSTARDLAALGQAVLADPVLAPIVDTREAVLQGSQRRVTIENTNLLLETYRGAIGVKTGFTALAGNVLVASAERGGRRIITVAMRSDDAFSDSTRLLDYGFARLARTVILRKGEPLDEVVFAAGATSVVSAASLRGPADPATVTASYLPAARLSLPLSPGDRIGTIEVRSGGSVLGSVPAVSHGSVEAIDEGWLGEVLMKVLRTVGGVLPGEGE